MNEFLPMITERDGVPVTTSRVVAEQFGKRHDNVLRDIDALLEDLRSPTNALKSEEVNGSNFGAVNELKIEPVNQRNFTPVESTSGLQFAELNFHPVTYRDAKGETRPMYLLTRDGFTLLAMGFTGARALQFKVAYINAFNRMERILRGGGLSSGNLQRIEERLSALEGVADNGRTEAGTSVADLFLQAIREALESGEYCLREKYRKNTQPSTGKLLGIVDGSRTVLKSKDAHEIYAAATAHPLKPLVLWPILEEAGLIYPRRETGQTRTIDGQPKAVIVIDTDKIR